MDIFENFSNYHELEYNNHLAKNLNIIIIYGKNIVNLLNYHNETVRHRRS